MLMHLCEACLIDLPHAVDDRGVLTSIESGLDVPFQIRRVFYIRGACGERGMHAHRETRQMILPVSGSFSVDLSDGSESVTFDLSDPNRGLYVPPMTWLRLYDFAPNTVCLVLADTHFADAAYIRDWDDFVLETRGDGIE